MSTGISLILLKCRKCGADLSGEKEGAFFYCGSCGAGFVLDENEEFFEIPVYFSLYNRNESNNFLPFWTYDAQLQLHDISASTSIFKAGERGFTRLFQEKGAVRMYVSAFAGDLEDANPYSLLLTYDQPELQFIERRNRVEKVVFSPSDARLIADHLFLMSEITQQDTLSSLQYSLTLNNPMLIVIGV